MTTAMPASRQRRMNSSAPSIELRVLHQRAVDERLQLLPFDLAVRQLADPIAHGPLRPVGPVADQPAIDARRGTSARRS